MDKKITSYKGEVKKLIDQHFLQVIDERFDQHNAFIDAFDEALKKLMAKNYLNLPKREALEHFEAYKKSVESLVASQLKLGELYDFDKGFPDFNKQLILFVEGLDEVVIEEQLSERFQVLKEDAILIKTGKWFKKVFRLLSDFPFFLANALRGLFKKEKKNRKPATHQIRLRNLARFYYKERLSKSLTPYLDDYYKAISRSAQLLWQVDEQVAMVIDNYISENKDISLAVEVTQKIPEAREILKDARKQIENIAKEALNQQNERFLKSYYKAGTFELSNRNFRAAKTAKMHYKLNQEYLNKQKVWSNTLFLLSDDWEIDLEIYAMIYHGLKVFHSSVDELSSRINNTICIEINNIKKALSESKKELEAVSEKTKPTIKKTLNKELEDLLESIEKKLIANTQETILKQDLPSLINSVEAHINEELKVLNDKRAVVRGVNFNTPTSSSSINYISPKELVNFETWPQFQKTVKVCKATITENINNLHQDLSQVGQITVFNMQSAVSLFEENGENPSSPINVAIEGLERAIAKAETLNIYCEKITEAIDTELLSSLQKFNADLEKFTSNENIYEIRVRIAKAKALERSKELRKEWVNKIKNALPRLINFVKSTFQKSRESIQQYYKRFGLSKEEIAISTEIADFLSEAQQAIEKLPFVYQRLFNTVPLSDDHLFEGRKTELNQLNNAYNNFMKGHFAATVIVGEKGCGITTVLNFFLQELSSSCEIYRIIAQKPLSSAAELMNFFSEHLKKKIKDPEDLVKVLNEGPRKIIVLENIQKLFLKKVGGFEALSILFEVLSQTSKNTFWVHSCTLYGWEYLAKTISVADNFGYKIDMREFDDDVITNIIMKRHRVSGYNLMFEPSPNQLNNKKFKKLSEEEKQNQLSKEYFSALNKIAKSNISIALVYWLRSTREVSDNTIHIASLKQLDFSFMKSLATEKLHAIAYLLLHDGLSEENFRACINKDVLKSRAILYTLFEDGILIKKDESYLVNPLLYRQAVSLLKTKNIIH